MLTRHRVPTIFNIYMLDVICCALGCVILLWQVAHQEAEEQTASAKEQGHAAVREREKYEKAQQGLVSASKDVLELQAALADWKQKHQTLILNLAMTEKEREEARKLAALRQLSLDKSDAALVLTRDQLKKLEQLLTMTEKEREDARKLAALRLQSLDKTSSDLTLTKDQLKKLEADLAKLITENKKTTGELTLTKDQRKKLEADLAKLLTDNKKTNADLTGVVKVNLELLAKIALADKQITSLKDDIKSRQADLTAAAKKAQEQLAELKLSEEEARKLKKLVEALQIDSKDAQALVKITELQLKVRDQDLERARKDLTAMLKANDKLAKDFADGTKSLASARSLAALLMLERDQWKGKYLASSRELFTANAAVGSLKLDKEKLNQRVVDLQAEVEQRFAGIPLTGENVVFLIDISGSMTMKDESTPDPDKWPFLCETLMQLMKSVRTMQRFQVILFSDKATYLFGNRDSWLKYEGPETAQQTRDALKKIKVEGGTNMHDAFDEAFRYRKVKLDTVYLFSDGLPNIGPGLPATITKATEAQSNYYLGKYVRDKLTQTWNRPQVGRPDVRINAVGFFFESPDVGAFLWAMAREHKGAFVGLR